MNGPTKFTQTELGLAVLVLVIISALLMACEPPYGRISKRGNITIGINNCRQIITALRLYSSDHDGNYPDHLLSDPKSSNEVFRVLFKKEVLDDEMIFGCPVSPFVPDGKIGSKPDFSRAVEAGENHWAMTVGLSDSAGGSIPFVYESPAVATWSPKWNPDAKGKLVKGRAWSNGIIIGMNDSSVAVRPLAEKQGTAVPLKEIADGKNLFTQNDDPADPNTWKILDVETVAKAGP